MNICLDTVLLINNEIPKSHTGMILMGIVICLLVAIMLTFIVVKKHRQKQNREEIESILKKASDLIDSGQLRASAIQIQKVSALIETGYPEFSPKINSLKERQKQSEDHSRLKSTLDKASLLIDEGKPVSAASQIQGVSGLVKKYPEFSQQIQSLIIRQTEAQNRKDSLAEENLNSIRQELYEQPYTNATVSKINKLKNEVEISTDQKKHIQSELKDFDLRYREGIIPKQNITHVSYQLPSCSKTSHYAFYTTPRQGTVVFPYRRQKAELRGFTEAEFESKLRNTIGINTDYIVLGDVSIHSGTNCRPYEPDIAIIEKSNTFGIRIDIEIDEPYSGLKRTPIHYLGCGDAFRDRSLTNMGWIVVRFSEKQIACEPLQCIQLIQDLIFAIDKNFVKATSYNHPIPDKRWSNIEAQSMALQNYREQLLHHKFGAEEINTRNAITNQTEQEKAAAAEVRPIAMPSSPPSNLNQSTSFFTQDSMLSFEPLEHVYLYNGKIQLEAVSDVINYFFEPFNALDNARRVAEREHLDPIAVLEQWDCSGVESREIGTFLHSQIESFLAGNSTRLTTHFSYHGGLINIDKDVSIQQEFYYFQNFLKDNPVTPFRTEWHIFDLNLKIAGTIDMISSKGNNHYEIYDWKRSKKASPECTVWRKGINGLGHIPDISFYHYALQQNLYKYILENNYNIVIDNMYIIVLHPQFGNYIKYPIRVMDREINVIKQYLLSTNR